MRIIESAQDLGQGIYTKAEVDVIFGSIEIKYKYADRPVISSGGSVTYTSAEMFPDTFVDLTYCFVQLRVKDTELDSSTYGNFIGADAVSTVAVSDDGTELSVINNYTSSLEFAIIVTT